MTGDFTIIVIEILLMRRKIIISLIDIIILSFMISKKNPIHIHYSINITDNMNPPSGCMSLAQVKYKPSCHYIIIYSAVR